MLWPVSAACPRLPHSMQHSSGPTGLCCVSLRITVGSPCDDTAHHWTDQEADLARRDDQH